MRSIATIAFLCALLVQKSFSQQYEFLVHRFCDIQLDTTPGQESVEIKVYPKAVDETEVLFKAKLKKTVSGTFISDSGVTIVLVKLPKEIINDHNRHINSGRWLVTLLGESKDYRELKNKLVSISTFRHDCQSKPDSNIEDDLSEMSYLGSMKEDG